ncbi:MAG TPA: DsrE family protein, partial [Thiobacillus sp.]|nr:DsrE family protein [Thiobacillus sp.]
MQFGILVNEGPYSHQASDSAFLFARTALEKGYKVPRVFFYHDGVYNASRL